MEEASQLRRLHQYIHAKEKELFSVKAEEVELFMNMLVDWDDDEVVADFDYLATSTESERIALNNLDKDLNALVDHAFHTGIPKVLSADSCKGQSEDDDAGDCKHRARLCVILFPGV
ncbi:hypothetical protein BDR07DRAFT_1487711 [Suillus spraguei]|nr:hypothetical protein BDR07DRAFT_1487711 [Suillus spraguei]